MKLGILPALAFAGAMICVPMLAAQPQETPGQVNGPLTENPHYNQSQKSPKEPANRPPPRSDNESSSNQTRIDLSPPNAEAAHPDGANDVTELHEWNPMRAMKDVEVGEFYYKQENYKAAISRFREALQYKPHDAVATFRLAQSLEKAKQFEEARARYAEYLTILKDGPSAGEARKALERLKNR